MANYNYLLVLIYSENNSNELGSNCVLGTVRVTEMEKQRNKRNERIEMNEQVWLKHNHIVKMNK